MKMKKTTQPTLCASGLCLIIVNAKRANTTCMRQWTTKEHTNAFGGSDTRACRARDTSARWRHNHRRVVLSVLHYYMTLLNWANISRECWCVHQRSYRFAWMLSVGSWCYTGLAGSGSTDVLRSASFNSRSIGWVTQKIIYFHRLENYFWIKYTKKKNEFWKQKQWSCSCQGIRKPGVHVIERNHVFRQRII